jgi:hypothetical protein
MFLYQTPPTHQNKPNSIEFPDIGMVFRFFAFFCPFFTDFYPFLCIYFEIKAGDTGMNGTGV